MSTAESITSTVEATASIENVESISSDTKPSPKYLILKLKHKPKPTVQWTEETIDNEHLGKKSSKRCCIYHKNKKFAESDSDESDSDTEVAKRNKQNKVKTFQRFHA